MDYLIMCIGNREGGDDAIGPYVADELKNDFTVIDSGLFMQGINLYSISDDAVLMNEDNEDLYTNNETVNDDLTINMK